MLADKKVTQEEINSFEMPDVDVGTPVVWHPPTSRYTELAFVVRKGGRNVMLHVVNRGYMEAVRHYDDPKLRLNSDQRENGAWDFTPAHKQAQKDREELLAKVEALEKQVNAMVQGSVKSTGKKGS